MATRIPSGLREFEKWLNASVNDAEEVVPALLALPGPLLLRELRTRPALRTVGVLRRLLAVARDCIHRLPSRAHEITLIVIRYARSMDVPADFSFIVRTVRGEAWRDHASALREIARPAKAVHAIRVARGFFENVPGSSWYLATVDLVAAPLVHEQGDDDEALRLVRGATHYFALAHDHARFLEGRMLEAWMLWAGGDPAGAGKVWTETAEAATQRGDAALLARLAARLGIFELRHGSATEASRLLSAALDLFGESDVSLEAVRTRWHLAEAAAAEGKLAQALMQFHTVRTKLMARGSLTDAALAAVQAVELVLILGRDYQLPSLTTMFVETFRDAGMPLNGMEALAYLRGRANAGTLRQLDIILVRTFFEDLAHKPHARFRAP
jgi:hypothetical protein